MSRILFVLACGCLFVMGGTFWKGYRRYGIPLAILLFMGPSITTFLACGLMWAVLTEPYGERTPWWEKALVGISFAAPSMLYHWTIWQAVLPVVWITLFKLSNWKPTEQVFRWKYVEFITGCLIGLTFL